jgi:hypothetical protein
MLYLLTLDKYNMNKYTKWYEAITNNAKQRCLENYTERHHIVPESLGGLDTPDNLVDLTAREHFICHWLLIKIYSDGDAHWKMLNALRMMRAENSNQKRYKTKITSRVYANLKEEYAKLHSERFSGEQNGFYGKHHSNEAKQRISNANKGRVQPLNEKEKQQKAQTGRKRLPFSEEWIANIKEARQGERNGMYGKTHSEETRAKQRARAQGRKQSPETIAKKAEAQRGLVRPKQLCPHCNTLIAVNVYPRWHGVNCKQLNTL